MTRPLVGIIGNSFMINDDYPAQACGTQNIEAVSRVARAGPMVVPATPGTRKTFMGLSSAVVASRQYSNLQLR